MAIKSNNSNEEVVGSIKSYSGLSNFNIIAVNPTMAELHANDIKVKTEPNYFLELNGEDYFKVTFWVRIEDLTTRLEILMQNKPKISKTVNTGTDALDAFIQSFGGTKEGGKVLSKIAKSVTKPVTLGIPRSNISATFNPYSLLRAGKSPLIDYLIGQPGDISFSEIDAPRRRIR